MEPFLFVLVGLSIRQLADGSFDPSLRNKKLHFSEAFLLPFALLCDLAFVFAVKLRQLTIVINREERRARKETPRN